MQQEDLVPVSSPVMQEWLGMGRGGRQGRAARGPACAWHGAGLGDPQRSLPVCVTL